MILVCSGVLGPTVIGLMGNLLSKEKEMALGPHANRCMHEICRRELREWRAKASLLTMHGRIIPSMKQGGVGRGWDAGSLGTVEDA